jgi:hypothetical protein
MKHTRFSLHALLLTALLLSGCGTHTVVTPDPCEGATLSNRLLGHICPMQPSWAHANCFTGATVATRWTSW